MKTWSFISLRKFRKLQHLLCFFGFRLKMVLASPNDQKYLCYPLVLKFYFSTDAAFGNSVLF